MTISLSRLLPCLSETNFVVYIYLLGTQLHVRGMASTLILHQCSIIGNFLSTISYTDTLPLRHVIHTQPGLEGMQTRHTCIPRSIISECSNYWVCWQNVQQLSLQWVLDYSVFCYFLVEVYICQNGWTTCMCCQALWANDWLLLALVMPHNHEKHFQQSRKEKTTKYIGGRLLVKICVCMCH